MSKVTIDYIGHSGFLVETERCLLLFDYYRGGLSGLSDRETDKPLYVFASHAHSDHYNPDVLKLAESGMKVQYLFSFDIRGRVPDARPDIRYLDADKTYEIPGLGKVETFLSTDEGVAFLIDTGDEVIFHAGDLHWWDWEGEDPRWLDEQETLFKREIGKLAGRRIDIAFAVLDDRLEDHYAKGLDWFLSVCAPACVLPMHFWEDRSVIGRFQTERDIPKGTRILDTAHESRWEIDV